MGIKETIYNRRNELGLTMKQLADAVGVSEGTISRWESGDIANMRRDKIKALADALDISPGVIMGWEDAPKSLDNYGFQKVKFRNIPILGEIACGEPIITNETAEYLAVEDAPDAADLVLIAKGDSMINARILDGDYVFIHQQPDVENGDIAAVIIRDEATLKRVYYDKKHQTMTLNAENPAYAPMVYMGEELSQIRIIGKAIAFQSAIR